jgi:hypothetical protein
MCEEDALRLRWKGHGVKQDDTSLLLVDLVWCALVWCALVCSAPFCSPPIPPLCSNYSALLR